MSYSGIVHEAFGDGGALPGIVGSNDNVALLGECEGRLPLVLKASIVGGRALRCVTGCTVSPDNNRERRIVAARVMVGGQNECSGWKQSAVDVLADIGEAREGQAGGDPERFGRSFGGLVLPLYDFTERMVFKVFGGGIERMFGDVGVLPQGSVEGEGLVVGGSADIVTGRGEVNGSCSGCKEYQLEEYQN